MELHEVNFQINQKNRKEKFVAIAHLSLSGEKLGQNKSLGHGASNLNEKWHKYDRRNCYKLGV